MAAGLFLAGYYTHVYRAPPGALVIGPGSVSQETLVARQITRSQQMDGATAFIGDSLTVGLATSNIVAKSENYGINSDTIAGGLARSRRMDWRGARQVVVALGVNSLNSPAFQSDYEALLGAIPRPVVAVAVFPVRPPEAATVAQIRAANGMIRAACEARPGCRFLDLTRQLSEGDLLARRYSQPDGIHLTPEGYRVVAAALRDSLAKTAP